MASLLVPGTSDPWVLGHFQQCWGRREELDGRGSSSFAADCGALVPSTLNSLPSLVNTFQMQLVISMLKIKRRPDEGWLAFELGGYVDSTCSI